MFHYALNPQGFLFLGTSETTGEFVNLFAAVEHKMRLYRRKDDVHSLQPALEGRFLPPC